MQTALYDSQFVYVLPRTPDIIFRSSHVTSVMTRQINRKCFVVISGDSRRFDLRHHVTRSGGGRDLVASEGRLFYYLRLQWGRGSPEAGQRCLGFERIGWCDAWAWKKTVDNEWRDVWLTSTESAMPAAAAAAWVLGRYVMLKLTSSHRAISCLHANWIAPLNTVMLFFQLTKHRRVSLILFNTFKRKLRLPMG